MTVKHHRSCVPIVAEVSVLPLTAAGGSERRAHEMSAAAVGGSVDRVTTVRQLVASDFDLKTVRSSDLALVSVRVRAIRIELSGGGEVTQSSPLSVTKLKVLV